VIDVKRAFVFLALLSAPVLAQEPDEATKKAALLRAYRENGSVAWGSVDATVREIPIVRVPKPSETPAPPAKPVKVAAVEKDVCARHHMRRKSIRHGRSWRCVR